MSKSTPGPWVAREFDRDSWDAPRYKCCDIEGDGGNRIVANLPDFMYPGGDDQCVANARLIAAAPELLEALRLADAMLSGANMDAKVVEKKVRAAIAKATGERA